MRKVFLVLSLSLLVTGVPAWSSGQRESGTVKTQDPSAVPQTEKQTPAAVNLRISTLKGPSGFGMIRMFETAPDLGAGVTGSYSVVPTPDVMIARLLSGETDIASLPTNVAAKLYNKGVPIVMGAVTGSGVLYLLSRDPAVKSFQDLAGKTVYNTGKGSSPEFIFEYLLRQSGMEKGSVKVDYTYPHLELTQAFIAGRVDFAVLPEPFVTKAVRAVPEATIALDLQKAWSEATSGIAKTEPAQENPEAAAPGAGTETADGTQPDLTSSYPMTVVVVRKSIADAHPEAVTKFLDGYRDSVAWVIANPGAAGKLIERFNFGLTAAEAADAVPRCNLEFVPAVNAEDSVSRFLSILLEFDPDSVGNRVPDGGFFYGN